jgi:hypothetical protein
MLPPRPALLGWLAFCLSVPLFLLSSLHADPAGNPDKDAPKGDLGTVRLIAMDDDKRTPLKLFKNGKPVESVKHSGKYISTFTLTLAAADSLVLQATDTSEGCVAFALVDEQGKLLSYSRGGMPVSKARRATAGLKAGKGGHWEKAKVIQREKLSPLRTTAGFPSDVPEDWRAIWLASSIKGHCLALVYPVKWRRSEGSPDPTGFFRAEGPESGRDF